MKETKIEKLILDLSNRWDCSPQEAVDRLNSMNESEINKLINSMTNKFKNGGMIDCLRKGGKTYSECKKCGGRMPLKAQDGIELDEGPVAGRIPRSSMFDAAREFMPDVDRKFVRQAYRAAKRQGRAAGNTGTYLRQDARDRVIEKFRNYADNSSVNTIETPMNTVERVAPLQRMTTVTGGLTSSDPGIIRKTIAPDAEWTNGQATFRNMSFEEAFNRARQMGINNFGWDNPNAKYSSYSTGLRNPETSVDLSVPNPAHTGGAINTPGWIAGPGYDPRVTQILRETKPLRTAWDAFVKFADPTPKGSFTTYDRKGNAKQMVDDFLNENSPRAKARLEK